MILSGAELVTLTGYKRAKDQARWLARNGWRHTVNALGRVVVARAEFDARLVTPQQPALESRIRWGANRGRQAA